jgi:hypothetical protein
VPGSTPEQIEFRYDEWEPVLERMAELTRSGNGWINLFPETGEDDLAEPPEAGSLFGGLLGSRSPAVPMGTWVARTDKAPASVGVSHRAREKVVPRLVDAGVVAPEGWRLVQDNPRRGLVVRLPEDATPEEILAWLMSAVDELCPVVITGHWLAEIHR